VWPSRLAGDRLASASSMTAQQQRAGEHCSVLGRHSGQRCVAAVAMHARERLVQFDGTPGTAASEAVRARKVNRTSADFLCVHASCSNGPTCPAPISGHLAARQRREKGAATAATAASSPAAYQRGASFKSSQQQQHKGDEAALSSRAADAAKQGSSSTDVGEAPSIQISGQTCTVSRTCQTRRPLAGAADACSDCRADGVNACLLGLCHAACRTFVWATIMPHVSKCTVST
jgi:hypothetical protein